MNLVHTDLKFKYCNFIKLIKEDFFRKYFFLINKNFIYRKVVIKSAAAK